LLTKTLVTPERRDKPEKKGGWQLQPTETMIGEPRLEERPIASTLSEQ